MQRLHFLGNISRGEITDGLAGARVAISTKWMTVRGEPRAVLLPCMRGFLRIVGTGGAGQVPSSAGETSSRTGKEDAVSVLSVVPVILQL